MNKLIVSGILIGLLLGPAYFIQGRYFSGQRGQAERILTATPGNGRSLVATDWHNDVPLHLSPSMNPIQLRFENDWMLPDMGSAGSLSNYYQAKLTHEGKIFWKKDWRYGFERRRRKDSMPQPIHSDVLQTFNVQQSGDYLFTLTPISEIDSLRFYEMKIVVYRNVEKANILVVAFGTILLLLSAGYGYWRMTQA